MSAPVNYYMEGFQAGAPVSVPQGQGSLVSILDGCLVNGFNSHTVSTSVTVSGTTATVSDTGHGFLNQQLVQIAGMTPAALNGTVRVTKVDANTFTYSVPSGTGNASVLGTAMTPSLGWSIVFTATGQRVYQAPSGLRKYLNVDDSDTTSLSAVPVNGYNACTGVNTGSGNFPDPAHIGGDHFTRWMRPYRTYSAGVIGWALIGDDKRFWLRMPGYSAGYGVWSCFGDITSYLGSDIGNCVCGGDVANGNGGTYIYIFTFPYSTYQVNRDYSTGFSASKMTLATAFDQVTTGIQCGVMSPFATSSGQVIPNISMSNTPNSGVVSPITGGVELATIDITEQDSAANYYWRRGRLPGVLATLGSVNWQAPSAAADGVISAGPAQFGNILQLYGGETTACGLCFSLNQWDTL